MNRHTTMLSFLFVKSNISVLYQAVLAMREAAETLAVREKGSYEEALLRFTGSRVYETLFVKILHICFSLCQALFSHF